MIHLKKEQTLKEFWAKRNGLRMKLQKLNESLVIDEIENMLTETEKRRLGILIVYTQRLLTDWNNNKLKIDRGLKVNE